MSQTDRAMCFLCEACCGLQVEHDGHRVTSVRGDPEDPFSRGYICPKAAAIADLQSDPDRLTRPVRRTGSTWTEIDYDEALDEAGTRLGEIQRRHGDDALGFYRGNPGNHDYASVLVSTTFYGALRTRNRYSAGSMDSWPRLLTSLLMYGAQTTLPIPDIDRTSHLLVLGANPVVSNGSIMTAPGAGRRLRALKDRGGRLVVIDPRRTETAALADAHHFIRPGTDVLLLLALLHTLYAEDLVSPTPRVAALVDGLDGVRSLVEPFTPERVAPATGIDATAIRTIARDYANAPRAACYGRLGTCTQEFGTATNWLVDVLNIVTGNFDEPGGAMFASPAVDLGGLAAKLGRTGSYDRHRSRVSGYPEVEGELPVAALAEEMETPGPGQIRGLLTFAGNPALSVPNAPRVSRALSKLDFMVSIDIYRNETTRHAHVIIPPSFGLEHDHYPVVFAALAVRNFAKYSRALLAPPRGALSDHRIQLGLIERLVTARDGRRAGFKTRAVSGLLEALGPRRLLDVALRMGGRPGLSLSRLREHPEGIDLGPLEPRLPTGLRTPTGRIDLLPDVLVSDLDRAARLLDTPSPSPLQLIGRRDLRSNNSWMHNSRRLVKGKERCQLMVHPADAEARGLAEAAEAVLSRNGRSVRVPLEITDAVMPGVVSLPHGWGHDDDQARLTVASERPGVNANVVTDDALVDRVSGTTSFSGVEVELGRMRVESI